MSLIFAVDVATSSASLHTRSRRDRCEESNQLIIDRIGQLDVEVVPSLRILNVARSLYPARQYARVLRRHQGIVCAREHERGHVNLAKPLRSVVGAAPFAIADR